MRAGLVVIHAQGIRGRRLEDHAWMDLTMREGSLDESPPENALTLIIVSSQLSVSSSCRKPLQGPSGTAPSRRRDQMGSNTPSC